MSERRDVRYWHKADIGLRSVYVADIRPLRSAPFPGQVLAATMCCLSLGGCMKRREFITLLGHAPSTLDARKNLSPSGKQSHGQGVVSSNASNTKLTPT